MYPSISSIQNQRSTNKKTKMNTKLLSTAEPTLYLSSIQSTNKPNPLSNSTNISSFNPHISKSRASTRIKSTTGRISAICAPSKTKETLYQLLGITESGTFSDIKKAYKQMARKYHPDVSPPERLDEYTTKFILVHEAYETLSDPQSRALYDNTLRFGLLGTRSRGKKGMDKTEDWKMRWESQLNELKKRDPVNSNCRGGPDSWAARMRNKEG